MRFPVWSTTHGGLVTAIPGEKNIFKKQCVIFCFRRHFAGVLSYIRMRKLAKCNYPIALNTLRGNNDGTSSQTITLDLNVVVTGA
jgi:hypothetical protein